MCFPKGNLRFFQSLCVGSGEKARQTPNNVTPHAGFFQCAGADIVSPWQGFCRAHRSSSQRWGRLSHFAYHAHHYAHDLGAFNVDGFHLRIGRFQANPILLRNPAL